MALHGNTGARKLNTLVSGMKYVIFDQFTDKDITQIELDSDVLEKAIEVAKRRFPKEMETEIKQDAKKASFDNQDEKIDLYQDPIIQGDDNNIDYIIITTRCYCCFIRNIYKKFSSRKICWSKKIF